MLLEPMTVAQKGITQAYEIQRRLKVWRPRTAAVMGSGTLGLLATLVLRLRGLDVTTFGRTTRPYLNADLLEAIGARYVNTAEQSHRDAAAGVRTLRSDLRRHRLVGGRVREHAGPGARTACSC